MYYVVCVSPRFLCLFYPFYLNIMFMPGRLKLTPIMGRRSGLCAGAQDAGSTSITQRLLLLSDPFVCSHVSVEFNLRQPAAAAAAGASAAPTTTNHHHKRCIPLQGSIEISPLNGKHGALT